MVVLKLQPHLKEHSIIVPVLQSIRRPLSALTAIHETYGELVFARFFNKKLLFVCNPEHIEQVYTQEAKGLMSRDFLYEAKKPMFGNGLVNSKSEDWTNQRRLLQPLFTKESVVVWEKTIANEAATTAFKLKSAAHTQINLTVEIKSLIQRIFIRILLGKSIETISNRSELIKAIDTISEGLLPPVSYTHLTLPTNREV